MNWEQFDKLPIKEQELAAETISMLRRLQKLKKDISQLHGNNGLIPNYRADTKSITSRIDTMGTNTHRFTSSGGSGLGVNLNNYKNSYRAS